eukprot:scaffold443587_cov18-Prasinocladus_malaysianus.AAC.1
MYVWGSYIHRTCTCYDSPNQWTNMHATLSQALAKFGPKAVKLVPASSVLAPIGLKIRPGLRTWR